MATRRDTILTPRFMTGPAGRIFVLVGVLVSMLAPIETDRVLAAALAITTSPGSGAPGTTVTIHFSSSINDTVWLDWVNEQGKDNDQYDYFGGGGVAGASFDITRQVELPRFRGQVDLRPPDLRLSTSFHSRPVRDSRVPNGVAACCRIPR